MVKPAINRYNYMFKEKKSIAKRIWMLQFILPFVIVQHETQDRHFMIKDIVIIFL